jgi:molecular chaperone DnaK (HSP70)
MEKGEVDEIVLVGGSTRIPKVRVRVRVRVSIPGVRSLLETFSP